MKKNAFQFFNQQFAVNEYSSVYKKINFKDIYPAGVKRLEIFINLLKKHKPKKIIDVGCGAGMPLIKIKKLGFDITGYDKAKNMVLEASFFLYSLIIQYNWKGYSVLPTRLN